MTCPATFPHCGTVHSEDGFRYYRVYQDGPAWRIDTVFIDWNGQLAFRDRWIWSDQMSNWLVHRIVVAQPKGGELISQATRVARQHGVARVAEWPEDLLFSGEVCSHQWLGVDCMVHRIDSFSDSGSDTWLKGPCVEDPLSGREPPP